MEGATAAGRDARRQARRQRVSEGWMRRSVWCGREDSNLHGISPTSTSSLRVYQFRHDRSGRAGKACLGLRSGGSGNTKSAPAAQAAGARAQAMDMAAIGPVEWRVEDRRVPYPEAVQAMEERVAAIHQGTAGELVWLLEHPPLYTAGTSARPADLLEPGRLPVHRAGRGGRYTYHGPGQRIAYVMLDLRRRGQDVRCHVH